MNNPDTMGTLDTQDLRRRQTKTKHKKTQHNTTQYTKPKRFFLV